MITVVTISGEQADRERYVERSSRAYLPMRSTLATASAIPKSVTAPESGPTPDAGDPDDEGEGAFGEAVPDVPVEPGTPSVENVAFVFLGVASTVALILHLVSLIG